VRAAVEQHLATAPGVREQRHQVRHRAARDEDRRLLAEPGGGGRFQAANGRIALARVVAQLGAAHRLAHLLGRQRDGVASQIDHGLLTGSIHAAARTGGAVPDDEHGGGRPRNAFHDEVASRPAIAPARPVF
jgi:hypothetical protein